MKPERWQQIDQVLEAALERDRNEWAAFLDQACAGDEELRREVESLLGAHEQAGSFIEKLPPEAAEELLPEHQAESLIGKQVASYRIERLLGSGGMGEVYLATDKMGRQVALKLLASRLDRHPQHVARFLQEARTVLALNHPNIVTIHDIGETDGTYYFASELIEGETLRLHLERGEAEINSALEIAIQVATALSYAHEKGIVHRDIKPENVMLRSDGYVKVLDFGIAKLTEEFARASSTEAPTRLKVETAEGVVIGTASYMSPEQAKGTKVDARTDLWSLGAVIYEMVTGHVPFADETPTETISLILQKGPAPLSRYTHEAPAELERIVTKALTKDREQRYQTAKDLLIDLRNFKRKLEVDAEIDRTVPPEFRAATSASSGRSMPATVSGSTPAAAPAIAPRASSAEYIVTEVKHHKLAAAIAVIALVLGAVALSFYLHARDTDGAIESIAVLPFENQNRDPNTEYLSDGVTESIINSLSQLPHLKVMSRNSVFHYKGKEMDAQAVAKELKVQAVLTGRIAQRGDGLSISVEMINAQDNSQIWGQQYNRKLADVFAVQEEIAKGISEKLRLKLTGTEQKQLAKRPTENLKAFQYYMQGRTYQQRGTREDLLMATGYFERALDEDRNYALAYAGLADAYVILGGYGYVAHIEGRRKAEEGAHKALALDENLAEAHVALGFADTFFAPYNFSLGDRELRRAIELSPSLARAHQQLGISLVLQGRLDEGLAEFLKARELDPLASIIARQVALPHYFKRDYARALELLRQADELGGPLTTTWEIGVYIQNRSFNEVLAELEKAKRERKNDSILIYDTGMVYAAQGKRAEALQTIKELEEMSGASLDQAHWIAKIYATLNEKELAFSWLERGLATGAIAAFYKDEPVWDPVRSDPRFADLVRRMGVPS